MHPLRKRRLLKILVVMLGLAMATAFLLMALKENINLYLTPSEIKPEHRGLSSMRLGGMVESGSVHHHPQSLAVDFKVTDYTKDITVHFSGVLPALFREGQGVVIEGTLNAQGEFEASRVLAKHDEKYMPPKIKPNNKLVVT